MTDNHRKITASRVFTTALAVAFVWATLWIASISLKIGLHERGNQEIASSTVQNSDTTNTPSAQKDASWVAETSGSKEIVLTPSLSVLIGGDVMLDRGVKRSAQKFGYDSLFTNLTPLFKTADIVMTNLEGPITSNMSHTLLLDGKIGKELTFTFATSAAMVLKKAGISVVSLANNHTDNFGMDGFKETKDWLDAAGVYHFGSPNNATGTEIVMTKNGISIAFVGYHAFQPGFNGIISDIKRLSESGYFVIVMPHWGTEYSTSTSADMVDKAQSMIEAGAGAIIGSHPHVVMSHKWLANPLGGAPVPVFYSLGNLLFDQYFSAATMKGNMVELFLKNENGATYVDHLKIYETSTASRKTVEITGSTTDEYPPEGGD